MSLQDRTEDVKFVDKPTEFSMSEVWQDQWTVFVNMYEQLCEKVRPVSNKVSPRDLKDNELDLTDAEKKNFEALSAQDGYNGLTRSNLRGVREWAVPCLPLNIIRKKFLSFNRRVNYEWCFNRANVAVLDYQHIREELVGYEEHLQLPEIDAPSFDAKHITPFVKEAHLIIEKWLHERYDHTTHLVKMNPYKVLELEPRGPTARRMLTPIDGDETPPVWPCLHIYNVRTLLNDLSEVRVKYDIETIYTAARAGLAELKNKFYN